MPCIPQVSLRVAKTFCPCSLLARQQLHLSQSMPHRLELNAGTPLLAEAFVRQWGHPCAPSPRAGHSLRKGRRCTVNCPDGLSARQHGKNARECHREAKSFFLLCPRPKGPQQWQPNCGECAKQQCGKKAVGSFIR
ncbi:hypothetical protein TraAM80_10056 [Trypanosoma rangeli]|uniref:Uncharacterized protein n=1 Tax=Trypanosoma rangeli TaxID=5698 RepID=A0A3R7R4E2_TRYRA|nr:uncharacterized protein TraAM80_10056 [Trypanosoma rangeli]RNE95890.1 hypothetical protein TraAM80_10056 [Trypanosoma rangeli]|eukprot:RNE95890.1 hypothetical protein TraAM80_10056 [Trypanosoma rangeli]